MAKKKKNGGALDVQAILLATRETAEKQEQRRVAEEAAAEAAAAKAALEEKEPAQNENGRQKRQKRSHEPKTAKEDRFAGIDDTMTGDSKFFKSRLKLPVWDRRKEICAAVNGSGHDVLILASDTGSGKSTQVPQLLCRQKWCRGKVAVTEPRRMAAITLAYRVAEEMGTPLGETPIQGGQTQGHVGYSVRFEHKMPRGAKIKYLTEGTLLNEMVRDASLREYSALVIDEVHERSINVDLLLGFARQMLLGKGPGAAARRRSGKPLKIVVMSATANVEEIRDFFSRPRSSEGETLQEMPRVEVLQVPGRLHPVEIVHTPRPVAKIDPVLVETVLQINREEPLPGDVLVFLWGTEVIESLKRTLEKQAQTLKHDVPQLAVVALYGQQTIEDQKRAFAPVRRPFTRKVILATNIAETSVTVPGVRYVVDAGKERQMYFLPGRNVEKLRVQPVAQSSAIQRAGRAGREGPGKCFRLYTAHSFAALPPVTRPEIQRSDINGAVLTMLAHGIDDVATFPLLSPLRPEALRGALATLQQLYATVDGKIIERGRTMAKLPVSPRYANVLVGAADADKRMRGEEGGKERTEGEKKETTMLVDCINVIACINAGDLFLTRHRRREEEDDDEEEEQNGEQGSKLDPQANADADADRLRRELLRPEGDLATYLAAMLAYLEQPRRDRHDWCVQRQLHERTLLKALHIRRQLRKLCADLGMTTTDDSLEANEFQPLHHARIAQMLQCFLYSFPFRTAVRRPGKELFTIAGAADEGTRVFVHPSSVLGRRVPDAVMFMDYIVTRRHYVTKVSVVEFDWVLRILRFLHGKE